MKPVNDQEENELVILHLRQLCEAKQKTHIHIGEGPSVRRVFFSWPTFLLSLYLVKIAQKMGKELLSFVFLFLVLKSYQICFSAFKEFYRKF